MTSLVNVIEDLKKEVNNRQKEHNLQTSPIKWREEYLYDELIIHKKKRKKVPSCEFEIPSYNEYENILIHNYNLSQLKSICRFYKQKIGGNKKQLMKRIYNYLRYSMYSIKIQSLLRGNLVRKLCKLKNIKSINKAINDTDFLTLGSIKNLKFEELYCYTDKDKNNYVFSIKSLYNYYINMPKNSIIKNPYNRKPIKIKLRKKLKKIRKISRILGYKINMSLEEEEDFLSDTTKLEIRTTSIFQKMDEFGFITNTSWFLDLNARKLKKFFRELLDTFNYRAQLSNIQKNRVLPNYAVVFSGITDNLFTKELKIIRKKLLKVINSLVSDGIDQESRSLGVFYVLGSLTTVSYNAALTLPWLFESFAHL